MRNVVFSLLSALSCLLRLEDLDNNLLLLDQEGADDATAQSRATQSAAVRSRHRLGALGHLRQFAWAGALDAAQDVSGVAAFGHRRLNVIG